MSVLFDPVSGLTVQTAAEVREEVQSDWINAFSGGGLPALDVDPETPAGQLIDSESALIMQKDSEILYMSNMFNPSTSEGRWQDALAKIYYLTRKLAESTVVQCQCTGLYGTVIPAGAIVESADGYQLSSLGAISIPDTGSVNVSFALSETGPIAIGAGTVTKIITVIPGWDTVNNAAAGVIGRDEETRSEFETRRASSVATNAHGSLASIYGQLAGVDGVLDLDVLENVGDESAVISGVTVGAHSICVCIYGGELTDIAEAIYRKKDAGCGTSGNVDISYTDTEHNNALYNYKILRPTVTEVKFTVTIRETATTPNSIDNDIKTAIYNEFYGQNSNPRVGLNQTVYASRFYPAVIAAGVTDLVSLKIALGTDALGDSITSNADIEPSLDVNNITVVIAQ